MKVKVMKYSKTISVTTKLKLFHEYDFFFPL